MNESYDYGLWMVVVFNILVFGLFALGFLRPRRKYEWRSMGVFGAFLVALFAEMYGFPLTLYVLVSLFGKKFDFVNPFGHMEGHLWGTLLGAPDVVKGLICQVGNVLMLSGLFVMGKGWRQIHRARGELVTDGIYRWVRHPQYAGLFLVTIGMLIQWPTLPTLLMWPGLMWAYWRLAMREERECEERFGEVYQKYREWVPAFIPRFGGRSREGWVEDIGEDQQIGGSATVFLSILGLVGTWFASPAQGGGLTGDEILAKVDSILNAPKDMVAIEKMSLIDKDGTEKVRDTKIYQKGSEWRLVRFLTPADVRGVSFLRLAEDRMYLYMPAFRKVRRIASHIKNENFMGTDFSYEDMSETEYTDNYVAKLSKDEPNQYVLELTPKPDADVSYSKLLITVDKSTFFYTRIEYYNKSDKLQKVLKVENIEKIGGYWMGQKMEMETVKSGHKTVLELSEINYDTGLSDQIFTQRNLKRAE